jgi:hypothetical protein
MVENLKDPEFEPKADGLEEEALSERRCAEYGYRCSSSSDCCVGLSCIRGPSGRTCRYYGVSMNGQSPVP